MKKLFKIFLLFFFSIYQGQTIEKKAEIFLDSVQKDIKIEVKNKIYPVPKKYLNTFITLLNKEVPAKITYKKVQHISYHLASSEKNFQLDIITLDLKKTKIKDQILKGTLHTKMAYDYILVKKNNLCYIMIVDFMLNEKDKLSTILQRRFQQLYKN